MTSKVAAKLAPLVGLEPTTHGIEVRCAIQLRYRGLSLIQWPVATPAIGTVSLLDNGPTGLTVSVPGTSTVSGS